VCSFVASGIGVCGVASNIYSTVYVAEFSQYSDSLWAGWSGDRIPVGPRFSAPFQTRSGAHPASYTMGTRSFLGVKRVGYGIVHPPPSSAKVKERVELYLYSTSGPSWPCLGCTLPVPMYIHLLDRLRFFLQEHVRDIKWTVDNPHNFMQKCGKEPIKAVIEHVRDGSTVRAFLLPDFYHVTLMLSGIRVSAVSTCSKCLALNVKFLQY
jgi:hypothetical protein